MSLLNKEPVKRAEKALKEFDETLSVKELENTARTALDAAKSLNCEVGAIVKSLLFKNGDNYLRGKMGIKADDVDPHSNLSFAAKWIFHNGVRQFTLMYQGHWSM